MMRDIGACFCYAQSGFGNREKHYITETISSLPYIIIKTSQVLLSGLSSLVIQGLNCFFYNFRMGRQYVF